MTSTIEEKVIKLTVKVMMASCSEREKRIRYGKIPLFNDLGRHLMTNTWNKVFYKNIQTNVIVHNKHRLNPSP